MAILNELAGSQGPTRAWRGVLEDKIDSTLKAGGRVYVAKHLLNPDEYADLSGEQDPFAPQVNTQFSSINGQNLYKQLQELFSDYVLYDSDFAIGTDKYFLLKRKQPEVQHSPTDSGDSRDLDRENSFSRSPGPPHGHRSYPPRRSSSALERACGPLGQKKTRELISGFLQRTRTPGRG